MVLAQIFSSVETSYSSVSTTEMVVFLTSFVAAIYLIQGRQNGRLKPLLGPMPFPILGNLPQMGKKPFAKMTEWWKTYGDIYKIQMGSRETVVLNGYKTIKKALVRRGSDFANRPDFHSFQLPAAGNSLAFNNYTSRWRIHRKTAMNALSIFINNSADPIELFITEQAEKMVEDLCKTPGKPLDPFLPVEIAVSSIVFSICFGRSKSTRENELCQKIMLRLNDLVGIHPHVSSIDMMPWTEPLLRKNLKQFGEVAADVTEFVNGLIDEHRVDYDPNVIRDALDACIKTADEITDDVTASTGITREQVLHTVQDIIAAGTESVTNFVHWSILYLADHPEIQERVQREIDEQIGGDRLPTLEDRPYLPYTEACILEIMRHGSIVPLGIPHSTSDDVLLDGYFIPKDTMVMINQHSVSCDETLWEHPDEFCPERFLTADGQSLDHEKAEQLVLFGMGKRRCIGEALGKMEVFLFFTTMFQRCAFEKVPNRKYDYDGTFTITWRAKRYEVLVKSRST